MSKTLMQESVHVKITKDCFLTQRILSVSDLDADLLCHQVFMINTNALLER